MFKAQSFPVTCHTDFVTKGSTFVVIKGQNQNGLQYLEKALIKGAKKIVVQADTILTKDQKKIIIESGAELVIVENTRKALAQLSAQAAGYPAKRLKLIGVTGTKGKTTTVHMLYSLLKTAGYKVAQISTVENKIADVTFPALLTTPQPDYLHQFFKSCVEQGVEYVVMEVAAQALTFSRLETLSFVGAIFTNLDQEHAELYSTMQEYFQTKCKLFDYVANKDTIFVNKQDEWGKKIRVGNDFLKFNFSSSCFPGEYNQHNLNGALSLCAKLSIDLLTLKKGVQNLKPLKGRLEKYTLQNGAESYIDYAHTPGSFKALFEYFKSQNKKIWVVFGAGGSKDTSKRPLMGLMAATYADKITITSDNPRYEDPVMIAKDITQGVSADLQSKILFEYDRKKAIEYACQSVGAGWVVLLLGKGPDEFQIVKDKKEHFSESQILKCFTKKTSRVS